MNTIRSISSLLLIAGLSLAPAAHAADQPFHFWFQRDGACNACVKMPPPGKTTQFPQGAGIDVMFNGFNPTTGQHWQNQKVQSYAVTYTYTLSGKTRSITQNSPGAAASVIIKPYATSDLNKAQVVSITVAATYASKTITKTANAPNAFQVY